MINKCEWHYGGNRDRRFCRKLYPKIYYGIVCGHSDPGAVSPKPKLLFERKTV